LDVYDRFDETFAAYDRAVALMPDLDYALGARLFAKLTLCNWSNLQTEAAQVLSRIRRKCQ